MVRILATAFGAFPGAAVNPTMAIVDRLQRRAAALRLSGIDIRTHTLPVNYARANAELTAAIEAARPDAVLHFGLAGRRRHVSIETRALNRLNVIHPDGARRRSRRMQVVDKGPFLRKSRYGAPKLASALARAGIPARLSIDAGDYLCNQILYLSMAMHDLPGGFVHVPRPRRLRGPHQPRLARPSLEDLHRAAELCLRILSVETAVRRRGCAQSMMRT